MPNEGPTGGVAQLARANEVRLQLYATAAARDEAKRARAIRIVRAALAQGLIDLSDLTNGEPTGN